MNDQVAEPLIRANLARDRKLFDNQIRNEWLPCKEAAEYLYLTPNALRILVCRGKIRAYKLGSRLRFRTSDLRSLLLPQDGGSQ
jgi:excisionase family DNA binding protein